MIDKNQGKDLPKFTLSLSPSGSIQIPKDFLGKWTLLYFYPKDDTPGCTKQACAYQESMERFRAINVGVYGVSLDSVESHGQFQEKYGLHFPLIADTEAKLSEVLGVYGDQEWKGKIFKGLSRDTFLINPEGKIERIWRKVDPTNTVKETYDVVTGLLIHA